MEMMVVGSKKNYKFGADIPVKTGNLSKRNGCGDELAAGRLDGMLSV